MKAVWCLNSSLIAFTIFSSFNGLIECQTQTKEQKEISRAQWIQFVHNEMRLIFNAMDELWEKGVMALEKTLPTTSAYAPMKAVLNELGEKLNAAYAQVNSDFTAEAKRLTDKMVELFMSLNDDKVDNIQEKFTKWSEKYNAANPRNPARAAQYIVDLQNRLNHGWQKLVDRMEGELETELPRKLKIILDNLGELTHDVGAMWRNIFEEYEGIDGMRDTEADVVEVMATIKRLYIKNGAVASVMNRVTDRIEKMGNFVTNILTNKTKRREKLVLQINAIREEFEKTNKQFLYEP